MALTFLECSSESQQKTTFTSIPMSFNALALLGQHNGVEQGWSWGGGNFSCQSGALSCIALLMTRGSQVTHWHTSDTPTQTWCKCPQVVPCPSVWPQSTSSPRQAHPNPLPSHPSHGQCHTSHKHAEETLGTILSISEFSTTTKSSRKAARRLYPQDKPQALINAMMRCTHRATGSPRTHLPNWEQQTAARNIAQCWVRGRDFWPSH